jgi:hypothetical protein
LELVSGNFYYVSRIFIVLFILSSHVHMTAS